MEELESIDVGTVKKFTLDGDEYLAKVIKVYDGDSITLVFKYGGEFRKWTCRLSGIDTPELRNCSPFEKIAGIKARDFLKSIILDKVVNIMCGDFDKYGRLLVHVHLDGININELLITDGYAVAYDGGKKKEWKDKSI